MRRSARVAAPWLAATALKLLACPEPATAQEPRAFPVAGAQPVTDPGKQTARGGFGQNLGAVLLGLAGTFFIMRSGG